VVLQLGDRDSKEVFLNNNQVMLEEVSFDFVTVLGNTRTRNTKGGTTTESRDIE